MHWVFEKYSWNNDIIRSHYEINLASGNEVLFTFRFGFRIALCQRQTNQCQSVPLSKREGFPQRALLSLSLFVSFSLPLYTHTHYISLFLWLSSQVCTAIPINREAFPLHLALSYIIHKPEFFAWGFMGFLPCLH